VCVCVCVYAYACACVSCVYVSVLKAPHPPPPPPLSSKTQTLMEPMQYKMQLGIQRIVCFTMVPLLLGLKYPAGVYIYWISNNLFTGIQVFVCVCECVCVCV
jgi:hypothetical protein